MCKFLSLGFGLRPAIRIFKNVLKTVVAILKRLNIRIIFYLDSMLLMSQKKEDLKMHTRISIPEAKIMKLQKQWIISKSKKLIANSKAKDSLKKLVWLAHYAQQLRHFKKKKKRKWRIKRWPHQKRQTNKQKNKNENGEIIFGQLNSKM